MQVATQHRPVAHLLGGAQPAGDRLLAQVQRGRGLGDRVALGPDPARPAGRDQVQQPGALLEPLPGRLPLTGAQRDHCGVGLQVLEHVFDAVMDDSPRQGVPAGQGAFRLRDGPGRGVGQLPSPADRERSGGLAHLWSGTTGDGAAPQASDDSGARERATPGRVTRPRGAGVGRQRAARRGDAGPRDPTPRGGRRTTAGPRRGDAGPYDPDPRGRRRRTSGAGAGRRRAGVTPTPRRRRRRTAGPRAGRRRAVSAATRGAGVGRQRGPGQRDAGPRTPAASVAERRCDGAARAA